MRDMAKNSYTIPQDASSHSFPFFRKGRGSKKFNSDCSIHQQHNFVCYIVITIDLEGEKQTWPVKQQRGIDKHNQYLTVHIFKPETSSKAVAIEQVQKLDKLIPVHIPVDLLLTSTTAFTLALEGNTTLSLHSHLLLCSGLALQ